MAAVHRSGGVNRGDPRARLRYVGAMATKRRDRPAKRDMPEPIPDTPDNIARALLTSPPREPDEWRYDTDRCENQD